MSLFGALSASLTSLTAQSTAVNVISNNIANLDTTGFKSTNVSFSTLITGSVGGGVIQGVRTDVNTQGSIESTGIATDLAIQGSGFFTVENAAGGLLYTRAGSFRTDNTGNLVNEAGYILKGWPLDSQGRLPGEAGNTTFTRSNQDTESLTNISTSSITGTASPTSQVTAKINLRAEEALLDGANDILSFTGSTENSGIGSGDIIIPTQSMAAGDTFTITTNNDTIGAAVSYEYGGFSVSNDIGAGIGGATNSNTVFTTGFTEGEAFTIDVPNIADFDAVTFTFSSDPNLAASEFSTFSELAQIVSATDGLNARISSTGFMYITPDDAQDGLTFTDVATGDLTTLFGFADVATEEGVNKFASLSNLAGFINQQSSTTATITSASSNATLTVANIDSTYTLAFSDSLAGDDILDEFLLDTTVIAAVYDPDLTPDDLEDYRSMASGNVSPDFSRTITVFTQLGESLDLRLAFTKIRDSDTEQTWAAELYAANAEDITSSRIDGLLAAGTVSFNGDGSLSAISTELAGEITIDPAGGAAAQTITLDLGTAGEIGVGNTEGLSQFAGQYSVDELSQNGFPTGRLQSLQIDSQGFVTAIFDNSLTSQVYKLPIAFFSNPNGLTAESGNAFSANNDAGEVTLGQVGDASVGTIVPNALEVSTAEIGTELTRLIVSQQAYSASANVLRKVTELFRTLQDL